MNKKFYIYQIKNDANYLFCAFEYAVNSGGIQKEDYEKAGELMKLHLEDSMRYALQQLEKST